MNNQLKKFFFQELGWLLCFPDSGNCGKYRDYTVVFREMKKNKSEQEGLVSLGELMNKSEFEDHFPHTVGFFKNYSGEGAEFKPEYMEIRIVSNVEEFWLFLNALNL